MTNKSSTWYLASSKPRQEMRAVENLANQGIHAFCPQIRVERLVKGKKTLITEALFKNYLFININTNDPLWHKVRSTRGIRDWIRFSNQVAQIPNQLVEDLISLNSREDTTPVVKRFFKGQNVRILSGPFAGLIGVFERDEGDARSMILIEFLGNQARLNLEHSQFTAD